LNKLGLIPHQTSQMAIDEGKFKCASNFKLNVALNQFSMALPSDLEQGVNE